MPLNHVQIPRGENSYNTCLVSQWKVEKITCITLYSYTLVPVCLTSICKSLMLQKCYLNNMGNCKHVEICYLLQETLWLTTYGYFFFFLTFYNSIPTCKYSGKGYFKEAICCLFRIHHDTLLYACIKDT
jgi:hypothetical protein